MVHQRCTTSSSQNLQDSIGYSFIIRTRSQISLLHITDLDARSIFLSINFSVRLFFSSSFRLVKHQVLLILQYQRLPLVYSFVMRGIGMIADGFTHVHLSLFSSLEFSIMLYASMFKWLEFLFPLVLLHVTLMDSFNNVSIPMKTNVH